jgi:methylenetetrahydrofolate dehydrogenase (NADP+)/methenyltetrahydrofolate cyclohydrolase
MAVILDGKALAQKITDEIAIKLKNFSTRPHLAVIIVGETPASQVYVRNKKAKAEKIGILSTVINLPDNIKEPDLIAKIKELNSDKTVDAILVQLPLPAHISENNVIAAILPSKDADGFTYENSGKLMSGEKPFAYPCTPKGIVKLLKKYDLDVLGVIPMDSSLFEHSIERESKTVQDAIKQFYFRLNLPQTRS